MYIDRKIERFSIALGPVYERVNFGAIFKISYRELEAKFLTVKPKVAKPPAWSFS